MSNFITDFAKDENLTKYIKIIPRIMLGLVLILVISLHVEFVLFEIYVSYLPQILIVLWGFLILIFYLFARLIIRNGWKYCIEVISYRDIVVKALLVFFMAYSYVFSMFTFAHPAIYKTENDGSKSFNIATYNKLYTNSEFSEVTRFFEAQRADFIGFQEIKSEELEYIRENLGFEYSFISSCQCSAPGTEIGFVSRYPVSNSSVAFDHSRGAIVQTDINLDVNTTVTAFVVHIAPPFSSGHYSERQVVYNRLEELVSAQENPTFLSGDFNTTVYSPQLRKFNATTESDIRNIETDNWPSCTWYGATSIACARIDQIFIPANWKVGDIHIGGGSGSDHRPVLAEIYP